MELVAGQSLGRYEITGHLGAGGMGVVYRARDAQLGRDVAVKVLNDRSASQPSRIERFAREAQAVARLSHPNILAIHDFGTHEGIAYAVTELLQGQTLADRIQKGPIPLNKAFEICRAVAEGLAAAHGEGIIHRDIKPSNIFITSTGQVKILDFGIARLREQPTDESSPGSMASTESLTGAAGMIGTVGYMSPEQIDGNPVDGRSDIFGLGCVMYEILTGRRAFCGKTSTDTMLAILGKDPEPIRAERPEVPQPVELIVERCLEKQPGERFESARDVAFSLQALADSYETGSRDALSSRRPQSLTWRFVAAGLAITAAVVSGWFVYSQWLAPPPPLPETKHLAVLRLQTGSDDAELQLFANGLTEAINEDLRLLEQQTYGGFWVVSSRRRQFGDLESVSLARQRFNVSLALAGTLHRRENGLVVELPLLDAETGETLRNIVIDDDFDNLVSFQESPFVEIARQLEIEVEKPTMDRIARRSTNVVTSFRAFLRAVGLSEFDASAEQLEEAALELEDALSADPAYERASCRLADVCSRLFVSTGSESWYRRGLAALEPQMDDGAAEVFFAAGRLHAAAGRFEAAVEALNRAASAAPFDAEVQFTLANAHQKLGNSRAAESALQRAISDRPGYWEGHDRLSNLFFESADYPAAVNSLRSVTRCAPLYDGGFTNLGIGYYYLDRRDDALRMFERSVELNPDDNYQTISNLGYLYFEEGRYAEAAEMFERALSQDDTDYRVWGNLGNCLTVSSEPERAEEPLRRAIELATEKLNRNQSDVETLSDTAGYYAMLGDGDSSREHLDRAIQLNPDEPGVIANIAEVFEDLGDRDRALEWVERALSAGVPASRFENRPAMMNLVSDSRYEELLGDSSTDTASGDLKTE